jgi:hypothetical protein
VRTVAVLSTSRAAISGADGRRRLVPADGEQRLADVRGVARELELRTAPDRLDDGLR